MKKTIIVTGGAGFIGSCVVGRLNTYGIDKILIVDKLRKNGKEKNLENKKLKIQDSQLATSIKTAVNIKVKVSLADLRIITIHTQRFTKIKCVGLILPK